MSILGVVLRARPEDLSAIEAALRERPGVDIAQRAVDASGEAGSDGRLVLVIEDTAEHAASATLGEIAGWPRVLNASLVYEYSGPESPAAAVEGFTDWRASLTGRPPRDP